MIRHMFVVAAFVAAAASAQENYATWGSMRTLTLDKSGITQKVEKFPLLVRLTSAHADVFANSKGRGADIRFTKADLATRYPHQIERWDSAGQKAEIWVLVDSVRPDAHLNFKMLWNKAGAADSSNGKAVFTAANGFVSVLHLGDSTGTNPRPNQVAGAPTGLLQHFDEEQDHGPRVYSPPEGVVGRADELRGGAMNADFYPGRDYIDLGRRGYAGFSDFTSGFFFSLWVNITNSVQYERFLEMNDDSVEVGNSPERIILFGNHTTAPQNISVRWGAGGLAWNEPNGSLYSPGLWQHIAFSKASGNAPVSIYINGQWVAETDYVDDPDVALREHVVIGRPSVTQGDPFANGLFDEVIIGNRARSASWIRLSHETQKPGASALTFSATSAPAAGGNDFTAIRGQATFGTSGFSARMNGRLVTFSFPETSTGRVTVFDSRGRAVWNASVRNGSPATWNGQGPQGSAAPGVYIARFRNAQGKALEHRFAYTP